MVHVSVAMPLKLLEGTKQYELPLYQRTYLSKKDQLQTLWDEPARLAEHQNLHGRRRTDRLSRARPEPSPWPSRRAGVPGGRWPTTVYQPHLAAGSDLPPPDRDQRPQSRRTNNEKYLVKKWEDGQLTGAPQTG